MLRIACCDHGRFLRAVLSQCEVNAQSNPATRPAFLHAVAGWPLRLCDRVLEQRSRMVLMSALQYAAGRACSTSTSADHFRRRTPQPPRQRHSISPRAFWPFTQTKKASSPAAIKEAKSKLAQLAGTKYGHNLSESQKQDVRDVLKELEAMDSREIRQKALGGSNWKLLYTESTGSSGGKVGPLVGQVDQATELSCTLHCVPNNIKCSTVLCLAGFPRGPARDLHQQAPARTYQS